MHGLPCGTNDDPSSLQTCVRSELEVAHEQLQAENEELRIALEDAGETIDQLLASERALKQSAVRCVDRSGDTAPRSLAPTIWKAASMCSDSTFLTAEKLPMFYKSMQPHKHSTP